LCELFCGWWGGIWWGGGVVGGGGWGRAESALTRNP